MVLEEDLNNEVVDNVETVETTTETGTDDSNVEELATQTTEETTNEEVPETKTYSQEELDAIVKRRVDRANRTAERKYGKIMKTLKAGMGVDNDDELSTKVTEFYKEQGIEIPDEPTYTDEDEKILADYEAKAITSLGLDEVVAVTDDMETRLDKMSKREKLMYDSLKTYRHEEEAKQELRKIGVKDAVINSEEFRNFAKQFTDSVPLKTVYSIYASTKQEEVLPIGSMQSSGNDKEEKMYYTPEEFDMLTPEQKKDPVIMQRVEDSMLGITGKAWTS